MAFFNSYVCLPEGRGFLNWGYSKWMIYKGKSIFEWMIKGYPHFRKPPYIEYKDDNVYIYMGYKRNINGVLRVIVWL